jgi:16S rRNA processing protein RimM
MTSRRRQAAARRRRKRQGTGSPLTGEPAFLLVGILRRPHGVKGEILMTVMTDFPERIQPGVTFYMGEEHTPVTIASSRHHNKGLIIRFEGFSSRNDVEHIRNQNLFVPVEDRHPLPEGEYYFHELIGLQVITDEGKTLGVITEMIETGANNVYVVHREYGQDILLPAIDEVILEIDIANKIMRVHILEGLLPK